jgi:hypothetical protein
MGKLTVHPGNKRLKGVAANQLTGERLRLFFAFSLEKMVLRCGGGAIFGSDDIEAYFYFPTDG